ncbi:LysM peptidoglycan-binding domain-containing protein [Burkholderia sp. AU31624]|uniref:LysM peptidoglycan-binding domain-containing protein n=1 Tax=Burkholderia sp. AU31624 TaxID=2879629 RepID=UPI001CF4E9A6|nr:LysM peptidoglycan-binding domain-containing protein [Burkholderia sp. AU31624]MCA8254360.1 LysM peptidoglycan-binding domain-containing protein [Burkholderia sp. AU31624]
MPFTAKTKKRVDRGYGHFFVLNFLSIAHQRPRKRALLYLSSLRKKSLSATRRRSSSSRHIARIPSIARRSRSSAIARCSSIAPDRKHNYYYLNGTRVGNQGNDGIDQVDYVKELAGKLQKGDDSQYKVFTPMGTADFDESFMTINGVYPGTSPGVWTVREGDSLKSIASALWGDETLWYVLADANGLKSADELKAGQLLTVPNKVTNVHNTASTFNRGQPFVSRTNWNLRMEEGLGGERIACAQQVEKNRTCPMGFSASTYQN